MKTAVTAASGSLGSAVTGKLRNEIGPENVIGIARTPEKANLPGIEIRKGDYNSREDFEKALHGVDAVLIISGMDAPDKRIHQHRNIIEAAKTCGVRKIVYTSITGSREGNSFSPIVNSNRQTEEDIRNSGLEWVIGRNGLYIEPDLEYIDSYVKEGGIINCAGNGKTPYTSREELAHAYFKMLTEDKHNGKTYNLVGEAITQAHLADSINNAYGTQLQYKPVSVEVFTNSRKAVLGEFLGTVIGGIYAGIRDGEFDVASDFEEAAGRPHISVIEMIRQFKNK